MNLNGKKTERVMLRVSEEMARQIRFLAEVKNRTVEGQVRDLIAAGLSLVWARSGNGNVEQERPQMSATLRAEGVAKATPRKAVSSRQQKQGVA